MPDDIVLRPYTLDDLDDLVAAFADPEILQWNPGPTTVPEITAWLSNRNDTSDVGHASWCISSSAGRLLGSVSIHQIDLDQRDAEIGYWVAPWARRQGVASRAVSAAVARGFGELGLHRIYLFHAIDNVGSCAVADSGGFRFEGLMRSSYRYADGNYHDEHLHARLEDE
jgi:RimJ/RimL family protein N-acetyltransferase